MNRNMKPFESVPWASLHEAIQANESRRAAPPRPRGATASIAVIPTTEQEVSWLTGWNEDTTFMIPDVVSLALWISDPLYRAATATTQRLMEKEEASALLHVSEIEWKRLGGRVRGWIRCHLEEDLRERAAGGDPKTDAWISLKTTKRAAHLVDYVCMVRGLRVALWWPESKTATVFPMTGGNLTKGIVQLNADMGRIMLNSKGYSVEGLTWPSVLAAAKDFTWSPPSSAPSMGAQTIAQIREKLEGLGITDITGTNPVLWNTYLWTTFVGGLTNIAE